MEKVVLTVKYVYLAAAYTSYGAADKIIRLLTAAWRRLGVYVYRVGGRFDEI